LQQQEAVNGTVVVSLVLGLCLSAKGAAGGYDVASSALWPKANVEQLQRNAAQLANTNGRLHVTVLSVEGLQAENGRSSRVEMRHRKGTEVTKLETDWLAYDTAATSTEMWPSWGTTLQLNFDELEGPLEFTVKDYSRGLVTPVGTCSLDLSEWAQEMQMRHANEGPWQDAIKTVPVTTANEKRVQVAEADVCEAEQDLALATAAVAQAHESVAEADQNQEAADTEVAKRLSAREAVRGGLNSRTHKALESAESAAEAQVKLGKEARAAVKELESAETMAKSDLASMQGMLGKAKGRTQKEPSGCCRRELIIAEGGAKLHLKVEWNAGDGKLNVSSRRALGTANALGGVWLSHVLHRPAVKAADLESTLDAVV
jgi:hypothetical protein